MKRWRHLDLGGLRCVIECRLRRLYCPGCGDCTRRCRGPGRARVTRATSKTHRVAGAADEPDAGRAAAADRVAHGRHDPRAGRRRQARPRPPGRARVDRRGRGLLRRRAQVPDLRRRPSGRRRSCGRPRAATPTACRRSSPGSPTSRKRRSRRSRSTCPPAMRRRSARGRRPARAGRVRPLPRRTARWQGRRPGPPRRVQPPRTIPTGEGSGSRAPATRCSRTPAKQTAAQLLKLAEVVLTNKRMYRAFLLYGELRYLYKVPKEQAPERLDAWLAWASRSRLNRSSSSRERSANTKPACSPRSSWT